jgi:hypothetical protein
MVRPARHDDDRRARVRRPSCASSPPSLTDATPGGPLILRDGSVAVVRIAGPADREAAGVFRALSRKRAGCGSSAQVRRRTCDRPDAPARRRGRKVHLAVRQTSIEERLLGVASYIRVKDRVAKPRSPSMNTSRATASRPRCSSDSPSRPRKPGSSAFRPRRWPRTRPCSPSSATPAS